MCPRYFCKPIAALLGLLLLTLSAQAAPLPWESFARSSLAHYLFYGTSEGLELFERITSLTPREAGGVAALHAHLNGEVYGRRLLPEVEIRLARIRERFAREREPGSSGEGLSIADQRLISRLATEELALDTAKPDQIQFLGSESHSDFAANRELFEHEAVPASAEVRTAALAPLKNAWEARLVPRIAEFTRKWPGRVQLVDEVSFDLAHVKLARRSPRKVLLLSQAGLPDAELEAFRADYVRALGKDVLSFPLKERATHLYVHHDGEVLDFGLKSLRDGSYSLPSAARIEPILVLTPSESARLESYMEAGLTNPREMLGGYGIDGIRSGKTEGKLNANRGTQRELHNCVSWISTAPLGEGGTRLFELLEMQSGWEMHTNPGWWASYLVTAASLERVPLVVYWSDEPMAALSERVRPGSSFPRWDFKPM